MSSGQNSSQMRRRTKLLSEDITSEMETPDTKPAYIERARTSIIDGITVNRIDVGKSCRQRFPSSDTDRGGTTPSGTNRDSQPSSVRHASGSSKYYANNNNSSTTQPPGLFSFLTSELTQGYALQNDPQRYNEKRRKIYAFVQIPRELEKFLLYGFLQCTDAFLYFFTLLPLRILLCLGRMCIWPITKHSLTPSEKCDLVRIIILVVTTCLLHLVDTSMLYHLVRGQAVIKLYIFYNMLEVGDKLCSSIGQDMLDALYWTATETISSGRKERAVHVCRIFGYLAGSIIYTVIHTLLILLQAATLNVAFNSHNKVLLTIMISNNFVELKGSVFKKFAKSNLFQMACSDVRERFHYIILLAFVVVRNMTVVDWAGEHMVEMAPDLFLVFFGEFVVDWVKHAFITKFNEIPYEVYKDFTVTLAYDVLRSRRQNAFSDHADQVSRRMGFVPLPLSALVVRVILLSVTKWDRNALLLLGLTFIALLSIKTLNSIILLGRACRYVETYEGMQQHALLLHRRLTQHHQSKSVPASPRLSLIEFNDVMQQNAGNAKGFTMSDLLAQVNDLSRMDWFNTPEARPSSGPANGSNPPPTGATNTRETPHRSIPSISRSRSVAYMQTMNTPRPRSHTPALSPLTTTTKFTLPPVDDFSLPQAPTDNDQYLIDDAADVETLDTSARSPSPITHNAQMHIDTSTSATPTADAHQSPKKRVKMTSECESLAAVDRYTLVNNDRIES